MERAELNEVVRATACAIERGPFTFLCDPAWPEADRITAHALIDAAATMSDDAGWLCVRTGGSGGGVKFARHDERTVGAAVRGFAAHFGLSRVNAVDVLPAHHVSGLMARARCAATGGQHLAWSWKRLEAGERPRLAGDDWVISLVPTQLQRLLASPEATAWLRTFRIIFLGGGAVWPSLAETAARAELRVSLSYGMTETAAMIAAQRPDDFLSGDRSSGTALPHARLRVNDERAVCVGGESLFRGYFPDARSDAEFVTDDLGRIDGHGRLHVLGRRDAAIVTGGKKVQPGEVEAALRASGEFADVAVIGVPDAEWGQAVVACFPATTGAPDVQRAARDLAPHQRPKRFVAIPVSEWPRNAQGKVNRAELERLVAAATRAKPDPT
jgi:O-succinylbenzoic acid--CoA ligase